MDFTAPLVAAYDGDQARDAITILDTSGNNVLNITAAINNISFSFGTDGSLGLTALTADDHLDFSRTILIKDWFEGEAVTPLSEIVITGPNGTRTFTAEQINSIWTPSAKNDSFDAHGLLSVSGNVLTNNGNGADTSNTGGALSVTAQTITTAHGGTVDLHADGSFTYTGASGYSGGDSFSYAVRVFLATAKLKFVENSDDEETTFLLAGKDALRPPR